MSRIIHNAFVAPLTIPSSRCSGLTLRSCTTISLPNSPNCGPTVVTASVEPRKPPTPPKRSNQKIRKALLVLIVTAIAVLPSRTRPTASASHQLTDNATVARALPTSSSYDPHAAGTPFAIAGTSAFVASTVAVAVTHPIDTIKTMRQARASGKKTGGMTLQSLYRGVSSNILKEAPNAAIYLAMYEVFKRGLLKIPVFAGAPLLAMCAAGMLGDGVGSIVRVPAEIVNKRLQLGLNDGWHDAVKEAFFSENGVEGTLASWFAVLWRDVPYGGLQIAGYELVRLTLAGWGLCGLGYSVIAGAIAGLFAAVITTPADVLVTRMSTQSPQCYLETKQYMSPSATFRRIIRDEGFGGLWTGGLARGLFYMPMIGLFFAVYETFKFVLLHPYASGGVVLSSVGVGLTALLGGYACLLKIFRTPIQIAVLVVCSMLFRR